MKIFAIILVIITLSKGCTEDQKQSMESATVEYTAKSRGFSQKIVINNKNYIFTRNLRGKDTLVQNNISDKDWNDLVLTFQDINLEELHNLKSPTEKRFYDGAAIANLKITFKDKTYESNAFDHGFPPQEIEKLVAIINFYALSE